MNRRRLMLLLGGLVLLTVVGGAFWWYQVSQPGYRLQRGQEAVRQRDWVRAEAYARKLENAGHRNEASLLWGELFVAQQQWRQALDQFNLIKDKGAIRVRAAALSGQCLLNLGNRREALHCFLFALEQQPNEIDAHRGLAAFHYDQGNLTQALAHLDRIARLDPTDSRPHRLMGLIFHFLEQPDQAIPAYQEARRRGVRLQDAASVQLELAECHNKRSESAEALAALDELPAQAADTPQGVALRAEALVALTRSSDAAALLDQALRGHPTSGPLLRVRGTLHVTNGQGKDAVPLLEQAVALDANDYRSRHQLARAYQQLGRETEAAEQDRLAKQTRQSLQELTVLSQEAMAKPSDARVRRRLAEQCRKLKLTDLATMWDQAAEVCEGL